MLLLNPDDLREAAIWKHQAGFLEANKLKIRGVLLQCTLQCSFHDCGPLKTVLRVQMEWFAIAFYNLHASQQPPSVQVSFRYLPLHFCTLPHLAFKNKIQEPSKVRYATGDDP